jgi:hypothetical protein
VLLDFYSDLGAENFSESPGFSGSVLADEKVSNLALHRLIIRAAAPQ